MQRDVLLFFVCAQFHTIIHYLGPLTTLQQVTSLNNCSPFFSEHKLHQRHTILSCKNLKPD